MSQEEISKYIICYIYGLKPDTAKVFVIVHEDHIEANYKNSFQQLIDNKIKFNGQEVIWGAKMVVGEIIQKTVRFHTKYKVIP